MADEKAIASSDKRISCWNHLRPRVLLRGMLTRLPQFRGEGRGQRVYQPVARGRGFQGSWKHLLGRQSHTGQESRGRSFVQATSQQFAQRGPNELVNSSPPKVIGAVSAVAPGEPETFSELTKSKNTFFSKGKGSVQGNGSGCFLNGGMESGHGDLLPDEFVDANVEKKNDEPQDNSGPAIQILRDADADPQSTTIPLEIVEGVFAEANAGGSHPLCGLNAWHAARGYEQVEIQVPKEKVVFVVGYGGETMINIQIRSRALVEVTQPYPFDGDHWIVTITGDKKQIETAIEMIKDIFNQPVRQSPQHQGHLLCGPVTPEWVFRGGFCASPVTPSSPTQPPQSYNEAKNDNHAPLQHFGHQPTPFAQGGPTTHSGYGPPQDQYGQSIPPPQQQNPYAPSGPLQQTHPNPPYGSAPANGGYGQTYPNNPPAAASPVAGYGQHPGAP